MDNINYQSFSPAPSSAPIDYNGMIIAPTPSPSTSTETTTPTETTSSTSSYNASSPSTNVNIQLSKDGIFIPEKALGKFGKYIGNGENKVPQNKEVTPVQPVSSPGSMNNGQLSTSISNLTKAINKNTLAREEPKTSDTKSSENSILPSSNSPGPSIINPPVSNSPATLSNTFKNRNIAIFF